MTHPHYSFRITHASGHVYESPFWYHQVPGLDEIEASKREGETVEVLTGECSCSRFNDLVLNRETIHRATCVHRGFAVPWEEAEQGRSSPFFDPRRQAAKQGLTPCEVCTPFTVYLDLVKKEDQT